MQERMILTEKIKYTTDFNAKKKTQSTKREWSLVSFFCGCGGLDLGFLGGFSYKHIKVPKLPFKLLGAYDNDEKCVQTYVQNISDHAEVRDLSKYNPQEIPPADVLIGGFPCQDFATCGPRHGLKSSRGRLYQALIDYMKVHRPFVVVGENVPGLANMKQGDVLKTIQQEIAMVGYNVKVWRLFAPDFGVPQRRTRLFIVAVRDDLSGFPIMPKRTFNEKNYRTTRWAIEDLDRAPDSSISNQSQYFRASRAKRGNGQGDETTPADFPSYTIRANAKSRIQFHYLHDRRLTVRECARLQTFPDTFTFPHSTTSNIMQIGNAVPPILGNRVARAITKYLEGLK